MKTRIAINGFGRIGRNVVRAIYESGRTDIDIVAINDLGPVETNAHLMRYDSVHGKFPKTVRLTATPSASKAATRSRCFRRARSEEPALGRSRHRHRDGMHRHLHRTGQRLPSTWKPAPSAFWSRLPSAGADKTIVYGVNHDVLTKDDLVVSNASCTTNCLRPSPTSSTMPSASTRA
jgi:glyceraldehyde 3-phosphate dehydrogenase